MCKENVVLSERHISASVCLPTNQNMVTALVTFCQLLILNDKSFDKKTAMSIFATAQRCQTQ